MPSPGIHAGPPSGRVGVSNRRQGLALARPVPRALASTVMPTPGSTTSSLRSRPAPSRVATVPMIRASHRYDVSVGRGSTTASCGAVGSRRRVLDHGRVATLRDDDVDQLLQRGSPGDGLLESGPASIDTCQFEHDLSERHRELDDVVGPSPVEHIDRLPHLVGVSHLPTQRLVHAGDQGDGLSHHVGRRSRPWSGPVPETDRDPS